MAVSSDTRRIRVNVPAADESVLQWVDVQDSVSISMRLLIREAIAREGYIDVMNKPIDQLPRRGRLPAGIAGHGDDADPASTHPCTTTATTGRTEQDGSIGREAGHRSEDQRLKSTAERPEIETQAASGSVEPERSDHGTSGDDTDPYSSINDLMRATRDK